MTTATTTSLPTTTPTLSGAHTLAEFAPYLLDKRTAHPEGLIPVGYWYPTAELLSHMESQVRALSQAMHNPRAGRTDPPIEEVLPRMRAQLEHVLKLPVPRANTSSLSERDCNALVAFLTSNLHYRQSWCGSSECRCCGASNGSEDCEDARFVWPSGLAHYVAHHSVGLPDEFVSHALRGGIPPHVEQISGFVLRIGGRCERIGDLSGRIAAQSVFASVDAMRDHVSAVCAKRGLPALGVFALAVTVTSTNGRISAVLEAGGRVPVLGQAS